ncbi:carbapenam-3-carboxylate synthase domain-containing protein [Biostraticola tofi]|uniref:Uncharacterized protein DUF1933 n=1 Tax=Biostraticola tofi TaxID=466109 RepID=A0A4V2W596_9GAMM|nr:carbapenam-3-carboxylate synthase domain-containing protein [Biostraticola tofi]TCV98894.1 uncharacterized protein DUF1933 [Biostraticola tofi]
MSNLFYIFADKCDKNPPLLHHTYQRVYRLKLGYLLLNEEINYVCHQQDNETWHIIGQIENLPLLNYLIFSHFPSNKELISGELIPRAIRRYGYNIIKILHGDFCIINEDAAGKLLVISDERHSKTIIQGIQLLSATCGNTPSALQYRKINADH